MAGGVFLIQDDGELVEMTEQPYGSEEKLQELLARYPNLLAGGQIDPIAPRRWLLVSREIGVPGEEYGGGRWAIDHLFLDQDAVPTLVEVKRSTNPQIRREVVGQMLEYAANAMAYWQVDALRAHFEAKCEKQGLDANEELGEFLGGEGADPESFWQSVKSNLRLGKLRMIFVADEIPSELQRIVEFLNRQMDPAEVLAVEIKQYAGENLTTLVPRVIGRTAERRRTGAPQWTEESILEALHKRPQGTDEAEVVSKVLDWAKRQRCHLHYGSGTATGAVGASVVHKGVYHRTFYLRTNGTLSVQFAWMKKRAESPFHSESRRRQLLEELNRIPGANIPEDGISANPRMALLALVEDASLEQFLKTFAWVIDEIRAT